MKKIALMLLAFILAACSTGTKSEFDTNLEKWQDANIGHYRYSLHISCFCIFVEDMPLTVEVQDGKIVSITKVDGTVVATDDPLYETFARYATIDRLFAELKADQEGAADEVTVKYDPTYGFPAELTIDFIKEAADDEIYLTISNLEVLE